MDLPRCDDEVQAVQGTALPATEAAPVHLVKPGNLDCHHSGILPPELPSQSKWLESNVRVIYALTRVRA